MFTALAAFSTVALMGLFAWKNHREGWVKHRRPIIENLGEADWKGDILLEVAGTQLVSSPSTAIDAIGFSQQLQNMDASLERLNAPVVKANPASAPSAKPSDRDKVTSDVHRVL